MGSALAAAEPAASFAIGEILQGPLAAANARLKQDGAAAVRTGAGISFGSTAQPGDTTTWRVLLSPLPAGDYEIAMNASEAGLAPGLTCLELVSGDRVTTLFQSTGGNGDEQAISRWSSSGESPTLIVRVLPNKESVATVTLRQLTFRLQPNWDPKTRLHTPAKSWQARTKAKRSDAGAVTWQIGDIPLRGPVGSAAAPASAIRRVTINIGTAAPGLPAPVRPWRSYFDGAPIRRALLATPPESSLLIEFVASAPPAWLAEAAPCDLHRNYRQYLRETIIAAAGVAAQTAQAKRIVAVQLQLTPANLPPAGRHNHLAYLAAFRNWLGKRYSDSAKLAAAWQAPEATLETAEPLPPDSWQRGTIGNWLHPAQQRLIDSRRFYNLSWIAVLELGIDAIHATLPGVAVGIPDGPLLAFSEEPHGDALAAFALQALVSTPKVQFLQARIPSALIAPVTSWLGEHDKQLLVTVDPDSNGYRQAVAALFAGAVPSFSGRPPPAWHELQGLLPALQSPPTTAPCQLPFLHSALPVNFADYRAAGSPQVWQTECLDQLAHLSRYGLPFRLSSTPSSASPATTVMVHAFDRPSSGSTRTPIVVSYPPGALADPGRRSLSPASPDSTLPIRLAPGAISQLWSPTPELDEWLGQRLPLSHRGRLPMRNGVKSAPRIAFPDGNGTPFGRFADDTIALLHHRRGETHHLITASPLVPPAILHHLYETIKVTPVIDSADQLFSRGNRLLLITNDSRDVRILNFPIALTLTAKLRNHPLPASKTHHLELESNAIYLFELATP